MNARSNIEDYCIIGTGAAGIILALELSRLDPDARITLLEYGKADSFTYGSNPLDDSIEIQNLVNHHPADECTNKGLGGTTNTWGGRCVMYDPVDFTQRPVVGGNCTWGKELYEECLEYVPRTQEYFHCSGPFTYPSDAPPIAEGFQSTRISDRALELWSLPTRFGLEYRQQLEEIPGITVKYESQASQVEETADGHVRVEIATPGSASTVDEVLAKRVVIAAGAFESTRLLLQNPHLFRSESGIPESLGKYYQGHLSGKIASVVFHGPPESTDFGFGRRSDGSYVRRRFQLSEESLVASNLLNTAIWLDNPLYYDPSHKSGAMSFMYLAMLAPILGKRLAPPAIRHSVTKGSLHKPFSHCWNLVRDFPASLLTPLKSFYGRYFGRRRVPGVFFYSKNNEYALHFHSEQVPQESNRFSLAADGSTLQVHFELCEDDIQSVIAIHKMLDDDLRANGAGHLRYWYPEDQVADAIRQMSRDGVHQCGTTRIASDSKHGVVDRNLKVFGSQAVYVASSSCFPTSSQANPTFFLGVLAIRLAEHLNSGRNATS